MTQTWRLPSTPSQLLPNTVDIWQANLNLSSQQLQQFYSTFSPDEQQRAQRFRFERDRHQYIAARGILRSLLGQYTNTHPAELEFHYSEKGKPELSTQPIQFNISHSHSKALYAITSNHRVGIDLEYIREIEALSLAKRFFTPSEFNQLVTVSPQQQQQFFFKLWTAKEAYLKATGEGLMGLAKIEIPSEYPEMHRFKINDYYCLNWSIYSIEIDQNYAAAVAVQSNNPSFRYWQWTISVI